MIRRIGLLMALPVGLPMLVFNGELRTFPCYLFSTSGTELLTAVTSIRTDAETKTNRGKPIEFSQGSDVLRCYLALHTPARASVENPSTWVGAVRTGLSPSIDPIPAPATDSIFHGLEQAVAVIRT